MRRLGAVAAVVRSAALLRCAGPEDAISRASAIDGPQRNPRVAISAARREAPEIRSALTGHADADLGSPSQKNQEERGRQEAGGLET